MIKLPQEIRDRLNQVAKTGLFDAHSLMEIVSAAYELGVEDGNEEAMDTVGDWYTPDEPRRNEGYD